MAEEAIIRHMRRLLNVSNAKAIELYSAWQAEMATAYSEWTNLTTSHFGLMIEQANAMDIIGLNEHLLNESQEGTGILLSAIHMGHVYHALLKVASFLQPSSLTIVVTNKVTGSVKNFYLGAMSIAAENREILYAQDPKLAVKVIGRLRAGGVVIMLFDLPRSFGRTTTVSFFNHPIHWAVGPAHMAFLSKSTLIPIVAFRTNHGSNVAQVQSAISFKEGTPSSRDATQKLAGIAQTYITKYPTQWLQWQFVSEMMV